MVKTSQSAMVSINEGVGSAEEDTGSTNSGNNVSVFSIA
jgi:hypothetical protein